MAADRYPYVEGVIASPEVAARVMPYLEQVVRAWARDGGGAMAPDVAAWFEAMRQAAAAVRASRPAVCSDSGTSGTSAEVPSVKVEVMTCGVTTKAAGERLGVSDGYVRRMCREGRLTSRFVGGARVIDELDIEEYLAGKESA